MSETDTIWTAQPRQAAFIACPADDVGFGGARGGGKSDAVLGDWIAHEELYGQHAIGLAFRRERTQLVELIERAKQILPPLGHKWNEQDKYFRGSNGGRLRFSYLENDSDADAYQGHSYTRIYPEEMGTFPSETPINKLMATLRSGQGVPCQLKGTCNPGGPGHQWVKARYNLNGIVEEIVRQEFSFKIGKSTITKQRIFIPSKVRDNKYLGDDYIANLHQVGSEALVQAWIDGNWDVVDGAFFDCWDQKRHVIRPFEIPEDWLRFRSMDWGTARPFVVQWYAVCQDDHQHDGNVIPRGALVCYREWYGSNGKPNIGLKLTAQEVAAGILERETVKERMAIKYSVLDPSAWIVTSGPSIAETMASPPYRLQLSKADNRRISKLGALGGWDQLRARLKGDEEGRPLIYWFSTCRDLIRTLPAMQHDPARPEDLDSESEDHAVDTARYAVMSRPWVPRATVKPPPRYEWQILPNGTIQSGMTFNELVARQTRRRRAKEWS